jgi:hypothetical protein
MVGQWVCVYIRWGDGVQDQILMVDEVLDLVLQSGTIIGRMPRGSHVILAFFMGLIS